MEAIQKKRDEVEMALEVFRDNTWKRYRRVMKEEFLNAWGAPSEDAFWTPEETCQEEERS